MGRATLTVGTVQVTAVCDVTADFPAPLEEGLPAGRLRSASPTGARAATSCPEVARQTRRRLLDRIEAEGMWLAPSHFPEPFGTVARTEDGRRWQGRP